MKYRITMMALAIVCVMVAPALSMPDDGFPAGKGAMNLRHERCPFLADNLTDKDLNNMTVGQLQEMWQQSRQNTTFGQAERRRPDRSEGGPMEVKPIVMENSMASTIMNPWTWEFPEAPSSDC